jgi:hypothetical protein
MQIFPDSKQGWLVFPFKAYVFIAPVLYFIIASFPRIQHTTPALAALPLLLLFPCALILLCAALLFSVFGPEGHALPCLGFAAAAFIIAEFLFGGLATA